MRKGKCLCPPFDCENAVSRCLRGDATATEELHRAFSPYVRSIAMRILGNSRSSEWEDVTQTVFLRLFSKLHTWRNECPFCGFVGSVAAHVAIEFTRRTEHILCDPAPPPGKDEDYATRECLQLTIAKFKPEWKRVVELREDDLTWEEIAGRLDVSRTTIANWVQQIRARLRPCVER